MYNWEALLRRADGYVDHFWGTSVVLTPMIREDDFKDAVPDPARSVVNAVAVAVLKKAEGAKSGGESSIVSGDVYISIREEAVTLAQLRKGDRVMFKGATYDVEIVSPSITGRQKISLLRTTE